MTFTHGKPNHESQLNLRAVTRKLQAFASDDRKSGLLMMGTAALGLLAANLPLTASIYASGISWIALPLPKPLDLSLHAWVQDGLLSIFFLILGLDLKEQMVTGILQKPKQALIPMIAAIGGFACPSFCIFSSMSIPSKRCTVGRYPLPRTLPSLWLPCIFY